MPAGARLVNHRLLLAQDVLVGIDPQQACLFTTGCTHLGGLSQACHWPPFSDVPVPDLV